MSADTLEGNSVVNRQGETLGEIRDIMIDVPSGRVGYAVLGTMWNESKWRLLGNLGCEGPPHLLTEEDLNSMNGDDKIGCTARVTRSRTGDTAGHCPLKKP